jgi:rfaE bifunctional protein nucleotidyltransferase chain/domain
VGRVYESWDLLTEELKKIRTGRRLVFTNGCFDLLHVGHVRYLQEARRQGDHLIVGVNTDASVRVLKGDSRPVQNERDRCEILAALGCVDSVTLFSEDTPLNLISAIRPDFLVKGGDYRPDQIVGASLVMSYGGEVRSLQFIPGVSTSSIISKLLT